MKHLQRKIWISLAIIILFCGGYLGYLQLSGNIHAVIPGQVYRSAQLNPTQLQAVIAQNHIKSIIDLAPGNDPELIVAKQDQVTHINLGLEALIPPSASQLKQLAQLIKTAQRPVLIHCAHGADRTGLASAMVLALTPGYTDWQIKLQYSPLYGAVDPRSIGKTVMGRYFSDLSKQNRPSTPERFQAWLQNQS